MRIIVICSFVRSQSYVLSLCYEEVKRAIVVICSDGSRHGVTSVTRLALPRAATFSCLNATYFHPRTASC
jgi:hypothetical protein